MLRSSNRKTSAAGASRAARVLISLAAVGWSTFAAAAAPTLEGVISREEAHRHGLERMWATVARIDPSRSRISHIAHDGEMLFVQSNHGMIQAIHAESGRTLWTANVGRPNYPTTRIGVGDQYVAVANGVTLYVLSRQTGREFWQSPLGGAPVAGAAVYENWVYVPLSDGTIEAHIITRDDEERIKNASKFLKVTGLPEIPPLATADHLLAGTSVGWIYSARRGTLDRRFRIRAGRAIRAPLVQHGSMILAASHDGYVYAFDEATGAIFWQFSSGRPISERPIVTGDAVYIVPETGGLSRISTADGGQEWFVDGVRQFISASRTKVYAADALGRTVVLDARNGAPLDLLRTEKLSLKLSNALTDRLYLGAETGLLQCLREIELVEPVRHDAPAETPASAPAAASETAPTEPTPAALPPPAARPANAPPAAEPPGAIEEDPFG